MPPPPDPVETEEERKKREAAEQKWQIANNINKIRSVSASTPLLNHQKRRQDDHPIFLRTCHSLFLSQKVLTGLRGITAGYLIATFFSFFAFEPKDHSLFAFFEFPVITFGILTLYHTIAFSWTFMHLHHPHLNRHEDSIITDVYKMFSPPLQTSFNRFCFSVFYMAVNTFTWVAAIIYWTVLVPLYNVKPKTPTLSLPPISELPGFGFNSTLLWEFPEHLPINEMFSHGSHIPFILLSRYLIAPSITLIEIYFYSSIKRHSPVATHLILLIFLLLSYIGWAYYGYYLFGQSTYYFFDFEALRPMQIMSASFCFVILGLIVFWALYAITAVREANTRRTATEQES